MSWLLEDAYEYRNEAQEVLERVKENRKKLDLQVVQVNQNTWIEKDTRSKPEIPKALQPIGKHDVEQAIAIYRSAKAAKQEFEKQMAEAERIVEAFGRKHLSEFVEGRLALDSGTILLRSGAARPVRDGKPLSTAARTELAGLLPPGYVRPSCDFGELFGCRDKTVRQLLRSRNIEIVRDDKFAIL